MTTSVSRTKAAFDILNVRIGGPYTVTATITGFEPQKESDIYVGLGQKVRIEFRRSETQTDSEELTVIATKRQCLARCLKVTTMTRQHSSKPTSWNTDSPGTHANRDSDEPLSQ